MRRMDMYGISDGELFCVIGTGEAGRVFCDRAWSRRSVWGHERKISDHEFDRYSSSLGCVISFDIFVLSGNIYVIVVGRKKIDHGRYYCFCSGGSFFKRMKT